MLFNVPQFIDVEDKVAGPFTAKQLLWMFGMGAVLLVLWNILEKPAFFVSAVPIVALFMALAFYRPYNQPLIRFILFSLLFLFRPKVYVWKRIPHKIASQAGKKKTPATMEKEKKKMLNPENIEALARVLDSEGRERNEKIMEIIKRNQKSK
ncbi:MAG: PrgI family protein [Candidatus Moranbacteria bacterium]|nr:PrgI family protein [Candidatus Moranbacteria bacterium]